MEFGDIIGHSTAKHLLLVCFAQSLPDRVRISSARRTTGLEQQDFEGNAAN
jgi:uncharacterized DUF497 family protein